MVVVDSVSVTPPLPEAVTAPEGSRITVPDVEEITAMSPKFISLILLIEIGVTTVADDWAVACDWLNPL